MLEQCVKDNNYARFHTKLSRLDVKFDKWSLKCRSRVPVHGVCLKSLSRTITVHGFIFTATTAEEKNTLFLDSTFIF